MRRLFFSTLAVAFLGTPALAADMALKAPPSPPVYSWTGFYVGGNIGYAWGHSDFSSSTVCGAFPAVLFNCGNLGVVQASGTGSFSANSVTGGVEAGYNWQADKWVYGAEVDFDSLKMNANRAVTSAYVAVVPGVPFVTSTSIGTDWLFTARGRLGWTTSPQLLLYATGGLALSRIRTTNSFQDFDAAGLAFGASGSARDNMGWTVGGGAEWMLTPNLSAKAEYLYVDLGHVSTTANVADTVGAPTGPTPLTSSFNFNIQILRAGLDYRFH